MISDEEFTELMNRVRRGDADAAEELVRLYEPEIRRAARLRMSDPEMRRFVDSVDISQSVFGRFFNNFGDSPDPSLQSPVQLLALLTKMATNRIIDEHRKQTAAKRGGDAVVVEADPQVFPANGPGPRTDLITREEIAAAQALLSEEEMSLLERRQLGQSWDEIAVEMGVASDSLRKRLERALNRVREDLSRSQEQS